MYDNTPVTITLPTWMWEGVFYHLQATVEYIPISLIDPDPYACVSGLITGLKSKLNTNEKDLNDL
jgi:hypothetical protein